MKKQFPLFVSVFLGCLTVGLSFGVLPGYVKGTLHCSNFIVGLVLGVQSAATLASRHFSGVISDTRGSNVAVGYGVSLSALAGLDSIPNWEKFYRQYLEYAYVNNTNRLMSFITQDAAERYRQLLEEDPEIVRRLPNRIVASYLNISPETLSRLKSKR